MAYVAAGDARLGSMPGGARTSSATRGAAVFVLIHLVGTSELGPETHPEASEGSLLLRSLSGYPHKLSQNKSPVAFQCGLLPSLRRPQARDLRVPGAARLRHRAQAR